MHSKFIETQLTYDGSQLRSHWILETTQLKQDAIVSFTGPCSVELNHMVDLEDVFQKKTIFSHEMLHFIVEHFGSDLETTILRQRLLVSLIETELNQSLEESEHRGKFLRRGDDLYLDQYKLTVSIATASPVSTLIHTGINIRSEDTPVPTQGLNDFELNPQAFANAVMNRYKEEIQTASWARCKVKPVN